MADKFGCDVKIENETGVLGVSGDSQKKLECRNDEEMVEIQTEIDNDGDDIPLNERRMLLLLSRDALKLEKLSSQELPIESKSLLHQSKDVLSFPSSTLIKVEPVQHGHVHSLGNTSTTSLDVYSRITDCKYYLDGEHIKGEMETFVEENYCEDETDHMLLRDRIKLLSSSEIERNSRNYNLPQEIVHTALSVTPIAFDTTHLLKNKRPRKNKKTVTISVQTALEEDAPGLVQLLQEKGIDLSEIKLYGAKESDELINDDSCSEGRSFSEFESLISKLFPKKASLLKLAPLRSSARSEKRTYCLACLVALVEQSRYLVFRKWPVEWGWCRDLKSFIFVFRRHNRIVLERPEYGYATYFFHLLKQLPIKWQIVRLVIAMKFTNRSRTSIIENKPLKVGDDLSEGEANVLKGYGWTANTGLASMLNYHDRVVHSRFNQDNSSEWKAKIVKMLTDALDGGYIHLPESDIPKKALEYLEAFGPDEKDEETTYW